MAATKTPHLLILALTVAAATMRGADWPMWKNNAGRTGVTDEQLPSRLKLVWKRELGTPRPAWPASQTKLQFDRTFEPVVANGIIYVPSMNSDRVTAYSADSGEELWRFYADGPARFAPVVYKNKLYFAADDGILYCLNAKSGKLLRKTLLAPNLKKVLGNHRMISAWPARGGLVLHNGKLYVAAGIWPFMGIFIYAIDAETGKTLWLNSGSGSIYIMQQHFSPAFAGVAPQGYMAVANGVLLVSGGRTVPAAYSAETGKFLYYNLSDRQFGNDAGGYGVSVAGGYFSVGDVLYSLSDGKGIDKVSADIMEDKCFLGVDKRGDLLERKYSIKTTTVETPDKRTKTKTQKSFQTVWKNKTSPAATKIMLKAGSALFCRGKDGGILLFDMTKKPKSGTWKASWRYKTDGAPQTLIAANGKLFAVTDKGILYCFGKNGEGKNYASKKTPLKSVSRKYSQIVKKILSRTKQKYGYCLLYGIGTAELARQILRETSMSVVVIPLKGEATDAFRREMDDAGMYGSRIALIGGTIENLPPYFADLALVENIAPSKAVLKAVERVLRPYSGKAFFLKTGKMLERKGPLPGAGTWTHQYCDAGNSVASKDKLVKLPLGILWFGGPPNDKVLPRHGHGPAPQVINGRLFIEGKNMLRAVDVYTGRLLWEKNIPNLGKYYDHTSHQPGANMIGSNYVSTQDAIYAITPEHCLMLSPKTGDTIKKLTLPASDKWGFIASEGDFLVAASTPFDVPWKSKKHSKKNAALKNADYASGSLKLSVLDRHSGKILWSRDAAYNFRHNAIIIGDGVLYCIDRLSTKKLSYLKRHGYENTSKPVLYAFDIKTGKILWKTDKDVFGTWLGYSKKHKMVIEAHSAARDRPLDEPTKGLAAFDAKTGKPLWTTNASYSGPCMLHKDKIIAQTTAFDILTGQKATIRNTFNRDKKIGRSFKRNYGCNTIIASEHLLTFRSAAAGYFDLDTCAGVGNLGGFKSGCTSNLIAADGVLNAPDYTRTCTCSYQNQSSLAMIHDPDAEAWTFSTLHSITDTRKIGINFGAPGDMVSDSGTLWLEYPLEGGPSPKLECAFKPSKPDTFRKHSSLIRGKGLKWVAASGVEGVSAIKMGFVKNAKYDINLFFSEPEKTRAGERVFSIYIEGRPAMGKLDVFKESGGKNRVLVKSFKNIQIKDGLDISFKPEKGKPIISGIEVKLSK